MVLEYSSWGGTLSGFQFSFIKTKTNVIILANHKRRTIQRTNRNPKQILDYVAIAKCGKTYVCVRATISFSLA